MKKLIIILLIIGLASSAFGLYRDRGLRNKVYNWTVINDLTVGGDFALTGDLAVTGNMSATTYGSDGSVTDAELLYINTLSSNVQNQLDARCLESVFGTAIGTGLTLDSTTLKTHSSLQSIAGLTETNGGLLYGTADNTYAWLAAGTANYLLQGNGAGAPSWVTSITLTGISVDTYTLGANDAVILPAPGTLTDLQYAGARIITLTAGYGTTAIGDLVYLNNDDSKFELTDGNTAATAADVLVGIVLEAVAEDASCKILLEGTITVDAWDWGTVGASLWISGTAGDMTQTILAASNDIVRVVGYVLDDDTIYFAPSSSYATVD